MAHGAQGAGANTAGDGARRWIGEPRSVGCWQQRAHDTAACDERAREWKIFLRERWGDTGRKQAY
jgi:hypothetical protein